MKLNFGRRLALFVHWLLSLLVCAFALVACISRQTIDEIAAFINSLIGQGLANIVGIAFLAVYVILAVLAVVIIFGGRGKKSERGFITVDSSETGRTRIAVGAVDQMIRQAVRSVDGITDMKASIVNNQDTIAISCNVGITSGVHVPTVTMNIQRAIRSYIELNCGVGVSEVSVSVHSMEDAEGGRGKKKGKAITPAPAAAMPVYAPAPAQEPILQSAPAATAEPTEEESVAEAAAEEEEAALPEIEPIRLTLEPPAQEDSEEGESIQE